MTRMISVVMPVYNCEEYLETSVNSILKQTYKDFEFVIVDDGSTDGTALMLKDFAHKDKRIKIFRNKKNIGVTKSLNKGVREAKGKYIVRMDADDWSYPERLKKQVKVMESNPDVVVSGTFINICDENLNIKYLRKYNIDDKSIRSKLFKYSPFAHPSTIWRSDILKKEKYSEDVKIGQDYELYFRVGLHGNFLNIDEPLLKLRMHSKSVSSYMNNEQSKATTQTRRNAVKHLGYSMSLSDRIYNVLQERLIILLPVRFRFQLFNLLRRMEVY